MMFDVAVYLVMLVAVIAGFNAGFLRSTMTILAYLLAMPLAAAATGLISPALAGDAQPAGEAYAPWARNSLLFFGLFLVAGIALGALLRAAVGEAVGARIGIPDRLAGSVRRGWRWSPCWWC